MKKFFVSLVALGLSSIVTPAASPIRIDSPKGSVEVYSPSSSAGTPSADSTLWAQIKNIADETPETKTVALAHRDNAEPIRRALKSDKFIPLLSIIFQKRARALEKITLGFAHAFLLKRLPAEIAAYLLNEAQILKEISQAIVLHFKKNSHLAKNPFFKAREADFIEKIKFVCDLIKCLS